MKRVLLTFAVVCAVICAVAASGCTDAPQLPADDLAISITTKTANVAFGAPFVLTVDRVWDAALRPEEWSDETLSPLVVRQRSVSLHEGDGRVLERRVFDAHAYVVGDLRVLPPLFVAVDPADVLIEHP